MEGDNPLKQLLLLGLGTTSILADRLRNLSEEWVHSGQIDANQARQLMDVVLGQLRGSDASSLDTQFRRYLDQLLYDLGVARQSEVNELRGRIDRLERQVRELENRH
jgi:polyhydroxyalkanoate synthesis regulator phasin